MDQLRWDALGCAGNPVVQTPNIDRVAREGARCEHFFVQSPVCQPSRATMFTGRYPRAHGVKWNWHNLPDRESTIAGTLSRAGYHTHAIGKTHFTPNTTNTGPASANADSTAHILSTPGNGGTPKITERLRSRSATTTMSTPTSVKTPGA